MHASTYDYIHMRIHAYFIALSNQAVFISNYFTIFCSCYSFCSTDLVFQAQYYTWHTHVSVCQKREHQQKGRNIYIALDFIQNFNPQLIPQYALEFDVVCFATILPQFLINE
jgi:hypothetical protein